MHTTTRVFNPLHKGIQFLFQPKALSFFTIKTWGRYFTASCLFLIHFVWIPSQLYAVVFCLVMGLKIRDFVRNVPWVCEEYLCGLRIEQIEKKENGSVMLREHVVCSFMLWPVGILRKEGISNYEYAVYVFHYSTSKLYVSVWMCMCVLRHGLQGIYKKMYFDMFVSFNNNK